MLASWRHRLKHFTDNSVEADKEFIDVQLKSMEFDVGDTVMLKVSPWKLPEKLRSIHNTFHVSNLKKCLADKNLVIPLKEIQLDDKLHFIEELVEIMDSEVKRLKQSRIPIVKVIEEWRLGGTKNEDLR
ncbi:hypothetical protein Tco_1175678 [Tanacetum coccineum]